MEEAGGGFRVFEAALSGDVGEVSKGGVLEVLEAVEVFLGGWSEVHGPAVGLEEAEGSGVEVML